jgi:hypothetical protein
VLVPELVPTPGTECSVLFTPSAKEGSVWFSKEDSVAQSALIAVFCLLAHDNVVIEQVIKVTLYENIRVQVNSAMLD